MRSGAVTLAVSLLLALALVRCEGQSSFVIPPVDAGLPGAGDEAACSAWAQSRCDCSDRSIVWIDTAQCLARETIACELLADDPNVPFDAAKVAACAEPDAGCFAGFDEYCIGPGRGGLGASCMRDEACESGYCAQGFDPASGAASPCGTCQLFPCKGGCPGGMTCLIEPDGTAKCVPTVGASGASCAGPNDCDIFTYCAPTGVCMMLPTDGEKCGAATKMGLPCGGSDEYCDPTNHCAPYSIVYVGYGQRCGIILDPSPDASPGSLAEAFCQGAGLCDPSEGICLSPASDGALCDDNQELGCLPPAQCIGNRCLFPNMSLCGGGAGGH